MERLKKNCYQITVQSLIDNQWSDWFEGMDITHSEGNTILTGLVVDQTALHGIINRIRDLNLTLVSVKYIESDQKDKPMANSN